MPPLPPPPGQRIPAMPGQPPPASQTPQYPSIEQPDEEEDTSRPDADQQNPTPFQPPATGEPSWQKLLIVFGAGFALTVFPLLFGLPPYGIQFIAAVILFLDVRKTREEIKKLAGYAMTGMMALMGLAVVVLGLTG